MRALKDARFFLPTMRAVAHFAAIAGGRRNHQRTGWPMAGDARLPGACKHTMLDLHFSQTTTAAGFDLLYLGLLLEGNDGLES